MLSLSLVCQAAHALHQRWRRRAWQGWRCWLSNRDPVKVLTAFSSASLAQWSYISSISIQHLKFSSSNPLKMLNLLAILSVDQYESQSPRLYKEIPEGKDRKYYIATSSSQGLLSSVCTVLWLNIYILNVILFRNWKWWRNQAAGWRNQRPEWV